MTTLHPDCGYDAGEVDLTWQDILDAAWYELDMGIDDGMTHYDSSDLIGVLSLTFSTPYPDWSYIITARYVGDDGETWTWEYPNCW